MEIGQSIGATMSQLFYFQMLPILNDFQAYNEKQKRLVLPAFLY